MNHLFRLKKFLLYQWLAKTKYYLHSPFVYQFYLNVLEDNNNSELLAVETLRKKLLSNNTIVPVEDMGTGQSSQRAISSIASTAGIRSKYGKVLYRLVKYFQPHTIIELGTNLGLSAAYLALGNTKAKVITLEGSEVLAKLATENHRSIGLNNIEIIVGNFDHTLPSALGKVQSPALIFFDGNHRKEATLRYFEQCLSVADDNSIFVFDDIYWSEEMYEAWKAIQQHPAVTLSIDIHQMGICFFMKGKTKESFMLRY